MVVLDGMCIVDYVIISISLKEGNSYGSIMADPEDSCVSDCMDELTY